MLCLAVGGPWDECSGFGKPGGRGVDEETPAADRRVSRPGVSSEVWQRGYPERELRRIGGGGGAEPGVCDIPSPEKCGLPGGEDLICLCFFEQGHSGRADALGNEITEKCQRIPGPRRGDQWPVVGVEDPPTCFGEYLSPHTVQSLAGRSLPYI